MSDDPIKDVLRRMPYGFYGITSRHGEEVNAMVANWVFQISFEPRLMALALQKTSYTYRLIETGRTFAVNLFHKDDSEKLTPFAKGRSKNPEKMAQSQYRDAPKTGCPILEGAAAYLECRVVRIIDVGGDHDLVIGEVVGAGVEKPGEAADTLSLPHLGWSYAG